MHIRSDSHPRLKRLRVLLVISIGALLGMSSIAQAATTPTPPASLPGPPPGAATGFPTEPASGSTPPAQPLGPAATIPTRVPGPGLLSGTVRLSGRLLTLGIACRTGGSASLSAAAIANGVIARANYTCRQHRGYAPLKLSSGDAHRLTTLGSTLGQVRVGRGGGSEQFSLTLAARKVNASFWSDGGLECSLLGPNEPYLVSPRFTVKAPLLIDVRPWIAFYTSANGWQWLGTAGLNHSNWYEWTATANGPLQWLTPAGASNPWTWAPIYVHGGRGTYAIGVFEAIYWSAHTRYVWQYATSHTSSGLSTFCGYP